LEPPSDSCCSESVSETRRLTVVVDLPGDHCKQRILKVLNAWRYAFPARRFEGLMRLVLYTLRQAIP